MANKITEVRETTDIISVEKLKDAVAKNNFVDLDQELINQIQAQVDNVLQNQILYGPDCKGSNRKMV